MRRTLYAPVGLLVLLLATQSNSLFAQKIELDPCYASLFRIECAAHAEFKDEDFYGVRGRLFLTDRDQREGNVKFKNHSEFEDTDPGSRAEGRILAPSGRIINPRVGDTLFNFKYGEESRANHLWGPVKLRFELRGRTSLNLPRPNNNWVEATGGLTFSR